MTADEQFTAAGVGPFSASGTCLRCVRRIHEDDLGSSLLRFVPEHPAEFSRTCIAERPVCFVIVIQIVDVGYLQVLHDDHIVFQGEPAGRLMEHVVLCITDVPVQVVEVPEVFSPLETALLGFGDLLLELCLLRSAPC